jgi:chondroitin-sulfate-ABC endolyase/exolyase
MAGKVLISFLLLLAPFVLQAQTTFSFEDGTVPGGFVASSGGSLSVSTAKYKLGTHSLQWNWQAGSAMTVTSSELTSAGQISKGGVTVWIYNAVPTNDKLTFSFLNASGAQDCKQDFALQFKGWRCFWLAFADIGHSTANALSSMVVRAPATGSGAFYFDYLVFSQNVDWERISDTQYTVSQNYNDIDNFMDARSQSFSPSPAVTDAQLDGLNTILSRLDKWYTGSGTMASSYSYQQRLSALNSWIARAKNNYAGYGLATGSDGVVTGPGLFPQYENTSIDGTAVKRFRDVSEAVMIPLAIDWRKNGQTSSRDAVLNLFDWYNDQGWADGSGLGTLRFEKLRSCGYFHALFMMRNDLGSDRRARELGTLKWFSLFGQAIAPFDSIAETADDLRALVFAKLIYALLQPDPLQQHAAMTIFRDYCNNTFCPHGGYLETFKNDYSGYHHRGTYFGAYYPQALYIGAFACYLLHGTPYALSDRVSNQIRQQLLMFRKVASLYDVPVATCGRFPTGTAILHQLLAAFAYIALSADTPDQELTATLKRLWQPDADPLKSQIARMATEITYMTSLGDLEACLNVVADNTVEAEAAPAGNTFLPNSGLQICRTPQWHVSIKGFSKYIWDYESSTTENLYGRYLSYGQLEYTSLSDFRKNNDYGNSSWNWNRIPGTTTKNLSSSSLSYVDASGNTRAYRNFSDMAFLGGTSLNDSLAIFSMQMHDNTFDKSFYANKSVVRFGDVFVCMGSNIKISSTTTRVETTLFQQPLLTGESVTLNGSTLTTQPTGVSQPVIVDNLGNGFIVRNGSVDFSSAGTLQTAVVNHGKGPSDASYLYYFIPKASDNAMQLYAGNSDPLRIVVQNSMGHVVENTQDHSFAAAVFNTSLTDFGWVHSVNTPMLLAGRIVNGSVYELAFADPDLHRATAASTDALTNNQVATPDGTSTLSVGLNDVFTLLSGDPGITVAQNAGRTTVSATASLGQTYRVRLQRSSTSTGTVDVNPLFVCNALNNNIFCVTSTDSVPFDLIVFSASGQMVAKKIDCRSPYVFALNDCPSGIYVIRAESRQGQQYFRQLVH